MLAPQSCPQTFVEEDASDPEAGEKQREILAAVHPAVEAGKGEGAGPAGPPTLTRVALVRTLPPGSLGSVDALEPRRAGGERRRHAEGPARGDHLQREVGWGRGKARVRWGHPANLGRGSSSSLAPLFPFSSLLHAKRPLSNSLLTSVPPALCQRCQWRGQS